MILLISASQVARITEVSHRNPRDVQIAGCTLYLGLSMRAFLEKMNLWSKADGPLQCGGVI
jgi:hypothetical protein